MATARTLTDDDVVDVLAALHHDGTSARDVAREFGITATRVAQIRLTADPLLDPSRQARFLRVRPETISRLAARHGDYPTNDPAVVQVFGRSRCVPLSALRNWDTARRAAANVGGRPRVRPPGLTVPQWRALDQIASGETPAPRLTLWLIGSGLVDGRPTPTVTDEGRTVLDRYPYPKDPR